MAVQPFITKTSVIVAKSSASRVMRFFILIFLHLRCVVYEEDEPHWVLI